MSQPLLRFLHAADFQLHQPLAGLGDVPDHLRQLLVDAPTRAAERVVETAALEGVDLVVLSGNIVDPRWADPHSLTLLQDGLSLLDQQGIAVYWAGGQSDRPDRWPSEIELPDGVHVFSAEEVEQVSHFRDDRPVANLMGTSWNGQARLRAAQFQPDPSDQINIVVGHSVIDVDRGGSEAVHYWAMGGRANRKTHKTKGGVLHYPGSPQGRRPEDSAAGACTLVEIDSNYRAHLRSLPTASLNWHHERLTVPGAATRSSLQKLLGDRAEAIQVEMTNTPVLVTWQLDAGQTGIGDERLLRELTDWLRGEFGRESDVVWTVSIEWLPPDELPSEWYDQDTLLGDYLSAVCELPRNEASHLSERLTRHLPEELADAVTLPEGEAQRLLLRRAAELGARLMTGKS